MTCAVCYSIEISVGGSVALVLECNMCSLLMQFYINLNVLTLRVGKNKTFTSLFVNVA